MEVIARQVLTDAQVKANATASAANKIHPGECRLINPLHFIDNDDVLTLTLEIPNDAEGSTSTTARVPPTDATNLLVREDGTQPRGVECICSGNVAQDWLKNGSYEIIVTSTVSGDAGTTLSIEPPLDDVDGEDSLVVMGLFKRTLKTSVNVSFKEEDCAPDETCCYYAQPCSQ